MKCSKTYILASVSLAVALMSSSALAAPKGSFKFNRSSNTQARSLTTNHFSQSTVLKSSTTPKLYSGAKMTTGVTNLKYLNSNVLQRTSTGKGTKVVSPLLGKFNSGNVVAGNPGRVFNPGTVNGNGPILGQPPIGPIGPIGPIVDPPLVGPIGPIGPIVDPPLVGPIGPIGPIGDPPVADPGNPPPADPGNPPADPGNPPADPGTPPTCPPPTCPPYDPGHCGGGWGYPLPFPFPVGGFGRGYCGTVVQPVYTSVVATEPVAQPIDLEVLEVRQLDRGDLAKNLGPAYRVTLRNKTGAMVAQQFNVALAASIGRQPTAESAFATVRVDGLQAGQVLTVELRLPAKAYNLGLNADGQPVPFAWLTAVVDSHQEVQEADRDNDVMVLGRSEIVMVAQK